MPIEVIERVNQLGKEQNQPTLLTFQYCHGHSTMDPDPYFQSVDIDIEGVIQDPDELDPNLQDKKTMMNTAMPLKLKLNMNKSISTIQPKP